MVRFTQYSYRVATKDLNTFIANAERFFPDNEWKITSGDMTIKTKNLIDAIKRLPNTDKFTFESGYADTFRNVFPTPDFSNVKISDEQRAQYANVVKTLSTRYYDSGQEVAIFVPINWDVTVDTAVVMAMLNEVMPLHGYLLASSTRELWIRKKGSTHLMSVLISDGSSKYTNCYTDLLFDLDDGFISSDDEVPQEFQDAFKIWVAKGRVGPLF